MALVAYLRSDATGFHRRLDRLFDSRLNLLEHFGENMNEEIKLQFEDFAEKQGWPLDENWATENENPYINPQTRAAYAVFLLGVNSERKLGGKITALDVRDKLNAILATDPECMEALIGCRYEYRGDHNDPMLVVCDKEPPTLGWIGILNGLFNADYGLLRAHIDEETFKLEGFSLYVPEQKAVENRRPSTNA